MGKIRWLVNKVWDRIGGDALWHIITEAKRYFLGRVGVWDVLTFITGGVISGYYAFQAMVNSWPPYFVVPFFIVLLACVIGIINGLWSLWDKWQQHPLVPQPAASPTLGPDEILHPPPNGVLWKWNPQIGADGPFCPTHRGLLLYINYSEQTKLAFEYEFLGKNGRFVCSTDGEEYKYPEPLTIRVRDLRARAYHLLQSRINQRTPVDSGEKRANTNNLFKIEQILPEIKWRNSYGGGFHSFLSEDKIPHDAIFALHIRAKITSTPPCFAEIIWLEIAGKRIEEQDWLPLRISDQPEEHLEFRISSSIAEGKHQARIIVRTREDGSEEKEKRSESFEIIIARSYAELQNLSGTLHQKAADLESKSEETSGQTEPKVTCEVYGIPLGLLVGGQLLLFVPEVTIVNHSHTRTASIRVELLVPIGGHGMACLLPKSTPIKEWEQASQYTGNRCLSFPLNLPAGNADGGYIAFGTETLKGLSPTTNTPNFKNCEVQFTDLHSGQTLYSKSLRFIINL